MKVHHCNPFIIIIIFLKISDTNRYNGEVGDVVVGRIKEVSPINFSYEAMEIYTLQSALKQCGKKRQAIMQKQNSSMVCV
jgi:exosome complex RNA-binding protein Rrp4